jgi:hypothetical protein
MIFPQMKMFGKPVAMEYNACTNIKKPGELFHECVSEALKGLQGQLFGLYLKIETA